MAKTSNGRWSTLAAALNEAAASTANAGLPDEILPGLYLGDAYHAAAVDSLYDLGVRHVLNATAEVGPFKDARFVSYLQLQIFDTPEQSLEEAIPRAVVFIDDAVEKGGAVFVHCRAGMSRSASLVIAYLCERHGYDAFGARHFCKARRSVVNPNSGFWAQLVSRYGCGAKTPSNVPPLGASPPPPEAAERLESSWQRFRLQPSADAAKDRWVEDVRLFLERNGREEALRGLADVALASLEGNEAMHRSVGRALGVLVRSNVLGDPSESDRALSTVFSHVLNQCDVLDLRTDIPLAPKYIESIVAAVISEGQLEGAPAAPQLAEVRRRLLLALGAEGSRPPGGARA